MKNASEDFLCVEKSDNHFSFSYVWNLTCLYHDVGYIYEHEHTESKSIETLDDFCEKNDINWLIWVTSSSVSYKREYYHNIENSNVHYSKILNYIKKHINSLLFNKSGIKIPRYTFNCVDRYFDYRTNEFKHVDHGISGGIIFYDLIIKNYLNSFEKERRTNHNIQIEEFFHGGLRFGFDHLIVFAYISDCIISHNIWKCPDNKNSEYNNYGLKNLIGNNFRKINYYENPLLFILVLSDSIEPYKNFHEDFYGSKIDDSSYSVDRVLTIMKNIDIKADDANIIIKVPDKHFNSLKEKINDLCSWVDISYTTEKNTFIITPN